MQESHHNATVAAENPLARALKAFIGGGGHERAVDWIRSGQQDGKQSTTVCLAATPQCRQRLQAEGYSHIHEFSVLPSHQHPRWLFPISNRQTMLQSLQIYVPLATRGRMLKSSLAAMISFGWKGGSPKFLVASREPLPLEQLVREVTGEQSPVFSLSLGNLQNLRALTVQVMRPSGEVLGYIKLPLTESAAARLRNEANVLTQLWNSSPTLRQHIPQVLYCGPWNDGFMLFQSSGSHVAGPRRFGRMHATFLERLWRVQPATKAGQVLVDETYERWRKISARLGAEWRDLGQFCLQRSYRLLRNSSVACGAMHGDFVPWNTRRDGNQLFVFDWESARLEAPILWDVFHFTDQSSMLLHEKPVNYSDLGLEVPQDDGSYLLYSLHSVCDAIDGGQQIEAKVQLRKRRILQSMESGGARPAA